MSVLVEIQPVILNENIWKIIIIIIIVIIIIKNFIFSMVVMI